MFQKIAGKLFTDERNINAKSESHSVYTVHSAKSQLVFQIQNWEVRCLTDFTLHYAWDVCCASHICILHMEKQFIYFYLIATMG